MKKIAIQSGHWNTNNGQTGAPRELDRTLAIGQRLSELLNTNGFQATRCDAVADGNPAITDVDWDLFISLHCDANYAGDEGGGFVDFPDPSVDSSNTESKRIKETLESVYFRETGIRNVPSRSNPNTKFYYMWSALSAKTPCVLIEMGESIDPHDNVLLNDTTRIANAIFHGLQKAFGVQTTPIPTPQPPANDCAAIEFRFNEIIKGKDASIKAIYLGLPDADKTITDVNQHLKLIAAYVLKASTDNSSIKQELLLIKTKIKDFKEFIEKI